MIRLDTNFYSQLTTELIKNSAQSGILSFGLVPYLSLFVIETYNLFSLKSPEFANAMKRQHENILRASTNTNKII